MGEQTQEWFFEESNTPVRVIRGCCASPVYSYPPHWHQNLELLCFTSGNCDVVTDSKHNFAKPGSIICVNSGKIHFFKALEESRYNGLIIHESFLRENGFSIEEKLISLINDEVATSLFQIAVVESRRKEPYYLAAQNAAILNLLVLLYRKYRSDDQLSLTETVDKKIELVQKAVRYINLHYSDPLKLEGISREVGVSMNHLCTTFRKETGITMRKYINSLRCHTAQSMLIRGNHSVTEVAINCGFDNMSYFSKNYREVIGEKPSDTIAKAQKKE